MNHACNIALLVAEVLFSPRLKPLHILDLNIQWCCLSNIALGSNDVKSRCMCEDTSACDKGSHWIWCSKVDTVKWLEGAYGLQFCRGSVPILDQRPDEVQ